MKLAIQDIEVDPTIQIRHGNHEQTIQRYEESFNKLPPVDVFKTSGGLLLADGFHRIAAAERLGHTQIEATVRKGTREDAAEHAVISNTKNADPLTPEERNDGIRRLKQLHPGWSKRRIADAMSVDEKTVRDVFRVDEVKQATFRGADASAPSDTHYREIAKAPKEHWQPLVKASQERGWTSDVTALATRNIKDDRIPDERKRAILSGEADPVVVTPDGQFAVPADVVGRQLRDMEANDAVLAMERALEALSKLRLFRPDIIVSTIGQPRLDRLVKEMPGYISFMQEVLNEATKKKRPKAVS